MKKRITKKVWIFVERGATRFQGLGLHLADCVQGYDKKEDCDRFIQQNDWQYIAACVPATLTYELPQKSQASKRKK